MDPKSTCSKSISDCENSSESVHKAEIVAADVNGHQTSDSVVLIEEKVAEEDVNGQENDSRMAKDGVRCSSISPQAVHEAESDTSKAKVKEFHMVELSDAGEKICRICHFGSDQSPEANANDRVSSKSVSSDLIEIGCKCKNELGLAHVHCAEAWFKLKGNSVCEICGCTAKNVTVRLMEEWSQERDNNTLDERRRRESGQSCCIFMGFLLTILFLHWFFKKINVYYKNT